MKKPTLAIQLTLIVIAAIILNVVFWGFWLFHYGQPAYAFNAKPPAANATLWQKEQWEQYHGAICTCFPSFSFKSPVILLSGKNSSISYIAFNITDSMSHSTVPNMTGVDITVSTTTVQKTVRADDLSVNLTRLTETRKIQGEYNFSYFESDETVQINIDMEKMGFSSNDIVPDQKVSLIVTPPNGYRAAKTIMIPHHLNSGGITEIF
jgi:hypothetical protein